MDRSAHVVTAQKSIRARAMMLGIVTSLLLLFAPSAPAGAESQWQIDGGGYGHGVGLSQYGACGMAAAGSNYSQILGHYYRGTAVTGIGEATDLRVLLRKSSSFTLVMGGTTTINGKWTLSAGETLKVTRSGNNVVVTGALNGSVGTKLTVAMAGSPLKVSPPGNKFNRGTLEITAESGGGLQAILVGLTTNEFLRGLGEMPSSWPIEALKAQAVAGRTIAQAKRASRGSSPYDLNALIDGAYIGHDKEFGTQGSRWVSAVDSTNGQVVTHGGGLISSVYSSSSGGFTESSERVWVSSLPYLRGASDPADSGCNNKNFRWSVTFSATALGQKLAMGPIKAVSMGSGAGVSGRLDKVGVTFTDSGGTQRTFTGAQLRAKLGLKSTKFSIRGASGNPSGGSGPPGGSLIDIRLHDGRNLLVAGTANDPDGAPRVVVATLFDGRIDMWVTQSVNGYYLDVHPVQPGKHTTCTAVMDVPTEEAKLLGCRENVVK